MPEVTQRPAAEIKPREQYTPAVSLTAVSKHFGDFAAVNDVSLDIAQNEFFSILGASGCGKTTLLRMIAGFEHPTSGAIHLEGHDVTRRPVKERNVNLVFQHYALFPHLNVFNNVAFELKARRAPRTTIADRVSEALRLVQLEGFERRKPAQLSGGQRQRVALARALVGRPRVLLLDEPLGALDQKLRKDMQIELKRLQREVGITFIYVTHDQEEALTMSDRIAVMRDGQLLQVDSPRRLYDWPTDTYVAGFVGQSNFLVGVVTGHETDGTRVHVDGVGELNAAVNARTPVGSTVTLCFRPERVRLAAPAPGENQASGVLREIVYVGNDTQYVVEVGEGAAIRCRRQNTGDDGGSLDIGDAVDVAWATAATAALSS